jgi:dTDP-4-dehydrorhamnose 3,5-epimerase
MKIEPLVIPEAFVITLDPIYDTRGSFSRIFCREELREVISGRTITQINHSCSKEIGLIRGLHFQYPPQTEMKIITCLKGAVFDVMVDIRSNSPTFLKWYGVELSEEYHTMVCIPEGCAHGFQVLQENSELLYLHTTSYSPELEGGLSPLDPRIGIEWPLPVGQMSERDRNHPYVTDTFKGVEL